MSDQKAAAELAELFSDLGEEPAATPDQPEVVEKQQAAEPIDALLPDDEVVDPLDQIAATAPKPVLPTPGEIRANIQIYEWKVIAGAPLGNLITGVSEYRFVRPTAIAVRSGYLYVVDEGADALYRYDLAAGHLETVLDLKVEVKGEVADIYVAKDFSFYLTDTEAARVLHYDSRGRLVQEYRNYINMVRPVAVTELEGGDVVIADGHYDHLLRFNSMGKLIATHGGRGAGVAEFLNILTMAQGPDGYYVGSRVGRRLQVLGRDGSYLYAFEEGGVVFPASIVVDFNNRSYVADYMDNTVKVFDRGALVGTIGSFGVGTGQFKRITDLWLDDNILYIADTLNGRIQAATLSPKPTVLLRAPSLSEDGAAPQDSPDAGAVKVDEAPVAPAGAAEESLAPLP